MRLTQSFLLALVLIYTCNTGAHITPLFIPRAQSEDLARELAGWTQHINVYGQEKVNGSFSVTPAYQRSFKSNQIAKCLFGSYACTNKCPASINISGSRTHNRGANDWLADYFYLPTDFQSTIKFRPMIESALADFNFYFGMDKWIQGLFFRFHAPFVWTRWQLHFNECVQQPGVNNDDAGYFSDLSIPRDKLLDNFTEFATGRTINDVTISTTTNHIKFGHLKFAKIDPCGNTETAFGDIQLMLGWNFLNCQDYHLGLGLRVVAPTGTRPHGKFLFEPIVGNGKFWEVGAYITSHVIVWRNDCDDKFLGLYFDAYITHMITTRQKRTFDLRNKPFSRYMLAERLGTPIENNLTGQNLTDPLPITPIAQFKNRFAPLANITTQPVRVTIAVQADVVAQCTFGWGGYNLDVGYNFWGKSCEKITSDCVTAPCTLVSFADDRWALKGDAQVFGFAASPDPVPPILTQGQAVALSATENAATINAGTNFPPQGTTDPAIIAMSIENPNIDNAKLAFAGGGNTPLNATPTGAGNSIRTSIQPLFISSQDIDLTGIRGISHKLYAHFSYNWLEKKYIKPFVGFGGFVEFASDNNKKCSAQCNVTSGSNSCRTNCISCALSQWSMWVKSGFSF
jgi:hypothetical protein